MTRARLALVLSMMVAVAGPGAASAQGPAQTTPATKITVMTFNLGDCIHTALDRQPRLAAARASLAAAEDGARALDGLALAALVDREISIRRRQACLGVTAASALVDQTEHEVVFAVTRAYLTVLYAREQEAVAKTVVDRLTATHKAAKDQLDAGVREVAAGDVDRIAVYVRLAQAKRVQAANGVKRALAALREAIGLEPGCCLEVPPGRLPEMAVKLGCEEVVTVALSRRGELARASIFVDVTCLEVEAQNTCVCRKKETFAAGSDIHSTQVPQDIPGTEFRPGAIPPEMPTILVGSRAERMKHALSLNARARAAAEVVRNLIALEAEDAVLRWEETSAQIPEARAGAEAADKLAENLSKDFSNQLKVRVEDVINARVLASTGRATYNEYVYKQLLALADLQRITAGGFNPGLIEGTLSQEALPAGKDKNN
jgi:outer membrane protein